MKKYIRLTMYWINHQLKPTELHHFEESRCRYVHDHVMEFHGPVKIVEPPKYVDQISVLAPVLDTLIFSNTFVWTVHSNVSTVIVFE